jgi:hypothetical protein
MRPPSGGLFLQGANVKSKSDRAASVGGLVFFCLFIGQDFLVECKLFDQPLDLLLANVTTHD